MRTQYWICHPFKNPIRTRNFEKIDQLNTEIVVDIRTHITITHADLPLFPHPSRRHAEIPPLKQVVKIDGKFFVQSLIPVLHHQQVLHEIGRTPLSPTYIDKRQKKNPIEEKRHNSQKIRKEDILNR